MLVPGPLRGHASGQRAPAGLVEPVVERLAALVANSIASRAVDIVGIAGRAIDHVTPLEIGSILGRLQREWAGCGEIVADLDQKTSCLMTFGYCHIDPSCCNLPWPWGGLILLGHFDLERSK